MVDVEIGKFRENRTPLISLARFKFIQPLLDVMKADCFTIRVAGGSLNFLQVQTEHPSSRLSDIRSGRTLIIASVADPGMMKYFMPSPALKPAW